MSRTPDPSAGSSAPAKSAPEFSRPIRLSDLERAPRILKGEATEDERRALAQRFGILSIEALSYAIAVSPWRSGGWRAEGVVKAEATQACVVTLEPAPETIEESFARGWLPAKALPWASAKPGAEIELYVDPELDEAPDLLGEEIDLGEVAAEAFALALDPYPRAPGAPEEAPQSAAPPGAEPLAEAEIHPFAKLRALKPDPEKP